MACGDLATSSSVKRKGRMAAWGHTVEQMLHWVHLDACQMGTSEAMPLFSKAAVPAIVKEKIDQ
jgi:hypothetical protein